MLGAILSRGWYPALITAIAIVSLVFYEKIPYTVSVPVLAGLLGIGLVVVMINARKEEIRRQAMKLTLLTTQYHRRFMGNSSISIFALINDLCAIDNPKIWEWARACAMSQRIFDTWSNSFATRVEADLRSRRFDIFLQAHLAELWSINNHYYEFIQQFDEIAQKYQIPRDVITQYNRFAVEYNAFVQDFRDIVTELRKIAMTKIEAPSINLVPELKEPG